MTLAKAKTDQGQDWWIRGSNTEPASSRPAVVPVQKCTLQTGRMLEHCLKEHKRAMVLGNTLSQQWTRWMSLLGVKHMLCHVIPTTRRDGHWRLGTDTWSTRQWTKLQAPYHQCTIPWFTDPDHDLTALLQLSSNTGRQILLGYLHTGP